MSVVDPSKIKFNIGEFYDIETRVKWYTDDIDWRVIYRQYIRAEVTDISDGIISIKCKHMLQDMSFPPGSRKDYDSIVHNMKKISSIKTTVLHSDIEAGIMSVLVDYKNPIRTTIKIHDVTRYDPLGK